MTDQLPEGAVPRLVDLGRWIARVPFQLPFRVRVRGRERMPATGPVVVVANHSSMVDGPLLFGELPRRVVFLIKQEMFRGPAGWFLRRIGQLAVRRGEVDRAPLLAAQKVLRAGGVVGVFPEGTRGSGDVASAQQGAAWLALSADAVVLPVACRGTLRPPGSRRRFRPVVDVLIGEPFALPPGRGRQALAAATEQVRDRLATLVAELDDKRSASGEAR
ncbi:lysophospholipid acyltransferase family protein [Saccharothrix coeruleofusca]|uniref:1-acyl-sn-glycerol-3-phosphate acyltransferase n=1 Tax=Saccharothrix coeruleofusca TaxID=33919 RepID=A0A918AR89_9PSEU|nr:lysophospholipid acyltransferase family protein [Saccharothrix coeruleofusca]MBP2334679.1 1-acyl-sn-glycerol-3-phosphate acyltransferase [Saccharothrix coeruleofusca]GGP72788.1 1-acyl-sn-glycerol-3-phosphate acyltransferase [Saccharothrix coeruleofusca]